MPKGKDELGKLTVRLSALTWCCFEKDNVPRWISRPQEQSPLKLLARILQMYKSVCEYTNIG